MSTNVTGLQTVLRNLNSAIQEIEGGTRRGMQEVGIFIKAESMEAVPHDKGVLINSAFYNTAETTRGPVVRIGYTAAYAPYVHEMPADFNYSKAGTGPKFLENPVKNNYNYILEIIRREASV